LSEKVVYRNVIYEEKVPFTWFAWLALMMFGVTALFLGFLIYSLQNPQNLVDEAPAWFWLIMTVAFAFVSWLILNFKELVISITDEGVTARYGKFKQFQPWANIAGSDIDRHPGLKYGGYGIRLGWSGGRPHIVYNTYGVPLVELGLKHGKYSKLVFSTRNPEEVAGIISRYMR